jgi:hypothetical protein
MQPRAMTAWRPLAAAVLLLAFVAVPTGAWSGPGCGKACATLASAVAPHAPCRHDDPYCKSPLPQDLGLLPAGLAILPAGGEMAPGGPRLPLALPAFNAAANVSAQARFLAFQLTITLLANASTGPRDDPPPGNVSTPSPFVPCSDPRGCPDLIVDEEILLKSAYVSFESFASSSCSVLENSTSAGDRHLLRFGFATPNVGDGDLIVGDPASHPAWFQWSSCHGHYHFRQYAEYRLWNVTGYLEWARLRHDHPSWTADQAFAARPDLRAQYVRGHKQGFCVTDVEAFVPGLTSSRYQNCLHNQGITTTWEDDYNPALDGQWVDVTGLPVGVYVLNCEVNPERFYQETRYDDNEAAALVTVR